MNWELAFQSTWNATIVFAGALAVGLLCYVFYRRKKERVPPRVFKLLVLLRSLAVLVIALFLLKPVIRYSRTEKENTVALVLLDISESMGIKDAAEGKTRLKAAMDALGEDKLLEKLQEEQKVHTYTFGSFVTEIENPDQFVKKSGLPESEEPHKATAIGEAVKETVSRIGESAISGLILLSDGINTKGANPQDVARFLGVPVYTLLAGGKMVEQGEFVDLGIASVPRDLEFIVDNKATIQIRVSNHGLGRFTEAERKLPLELKQKGENLASKHILFPASDGMREVEISYTPEKTGLYELELSFPVLEGETIEKNNKRTFTVRIIDPKIPTLLVEGTVRQEYKFLRHVLESDPNVEFTSVIKLRKDRFFHQGVDPGIKLNMGLPVHKKDYEKFDVIILGDISRREFSETQLEYLQEFVGDGGGLCVMGGYHALGAGGWADSHVAEMLPVRIGDDDGHINAKFLPKLTIAGRNHPVLEGCKEFFSRGSQRALLDGANKVSGVLGGAEVLTVHPTERVAGEPLPIIATRKYGGGRVLALMADTTWKWKFQVEARGLESPYYRFWRQTVRWLSQPSTEEFEGEENIRAWPGKTQYKHGEEMQLHARVRGHDKQPLENVTVTAAIEYPVKVKKLNERGQEYTESSAEVALQPIPLSMGQYQSTFQPPAGGIYKVTVSASDDAGPLGKAQFDFVVGKPTTEFDRVDVDELAMRSVAGESGGKFYELKDAAQIPDDLEEKRRNVTHQEELNLWNAPGFFMILLACLSAEWFLRKRFALS